MNPVEVGGDAVAVDQPVERGPQYAAAPADGQLIPPLSVGPGLSQHRRPTLPK